MIVLFGLDLESTLVFHQPTDEPSGFATERDIHRAPLRAYRWFLHDRGALSLTAFLPFCGDLLCSRRTLSSTRVDASDFEATAPPQLRGLDRRRSLRARRPCLCRRSRHRRCASLGPDLRSAWLDRPSSYVIFFIPSIKTHFCCGHPQLAFERLPATKNPPPTPTRDIGALIVTTSPAVYLRRAKTPDVETPRNLP